MYRQNATTRSLFNVRSPIPYLSGKRLCDMGVTDYDDCQGGCAPYDDHPWDYNCEYRDYDQATYDYDRGRVWKHA